MDKIGARIKKIRQLLNKSQEELARECNVTKQAISNIENSKSHPSLSFLEKLYNNYDANLNYIIVGKGEYFTTNEKSFKNLRDSLIKEVENFLDKQGIN